MNESNGQETLSGWLLALVGGRYVVGRMTEGIVAGSTKLSPVYEMRCDFLPLPAEVAPGKVAMVPQMVRQLTPLGLCVSWDAMLLPSDAPVMPLTALADGDQKEIAAMIAHVREGIKRAETQQRSGLVLPGGAR
jgi:hypothetical protein